MNPAWDVYILSNGAHMLYVGSTNNLSWRFYEHRTKSHARAFTARYTFDRVVYFELLSCDTAARLREKQLKGWTRARKVALIVADKPRWTNLVPTWGEFVRRYGAGG